MRQITLSVTQYPSETNVRVALQEHLLRLNGADAFRTRNEPTFGIASVITSKPAIRYHFKTGQRDWPKT